MVKENFEEEKLDHQKKEVFENFFKENWLSVILAGVGLVLVLVGGIVMLRESGFKSEEEVVIEEEAAKDEKITVDIQGAVLTPGVYELPFGSRASDLLITAGGLSEEADRDWVAKNLNQAAKLKDGEKFYIPNKGEGQVEGSQSAVGAKVNINTASLSELDSLPDIGKMRGESIIDGRPYSRIEELLERKIIPTSSFEKIKDKISVY